MPRWRRSAPRTQRTHGGDDRGSLGEAVPYPGPWHTTYPRPEGREPTRRRTWPTCESRAAPSVPHPGSLPCAPPQLASPLRWSSYNTLRRHSRRRSPLVVYRPPRAWRWCFPGPPRGTLRRRGPQLGERPVEVLLHVAAESLERRDVEHLGLVGQRPVIGGAH